MAGAALLGDPPLPDPIFAFFENLLMNDFQPLLHIATLVSYFMGLCFILIGMSRLHRHGQGVGGMYQRVSPMATSMYFISAVVLISFVPYLQMLTNSMFNGEINPFLMNKCAVAQTGSFTTHSNDFCPMMAYSTQVDLASKNPDAGVGVAIKYVVFALMFLVGIISFIRGMISLVKLGEGGGQGQTLGRSLTFIFAGIVGVNMDVFYTLIQGILTSTAGT